MSCSNRFVLNEMIFSQLFKNRNTVKNYIIKIYSNKNRYETYIQENHINNKLELWGTEPYYNGNFPILFLDREEFIKLYKVEILFDYYYNTNGRLFTIDELIQTFYHTRYHWDKHIRNFGIEMGYISEDDDEDENKKVILKITDKLDCIKHQIQDIQYKELLELLGKIYIS